MGVLGTKAPWKLGALVGETPCEIGNKVNWRLGNLVVQPVWFQADWKNIVN